MKKLFYFIVLFSIFSGYMIGRFEATTPPPATSSATERPLIDYVNEVRSERKLTALREDPGLDQTAKLKAEDMAARNYWEHTTPDGDPFYLAIQKIRPGLQSYGENLAECYKSNIETVQAWEKSEGHLANMIRPDYTLFGSATVYDNDRNCTITVNHFGKE